MKKPKFKKGFTLVEVLVTVTVFAAVISVSSSIFLSVGNLQKRVVELKTLQNEGRYLMEKMVREIRAREIDYSAIASSEDNLIMTRELVFKPDKDDEVYTIEFAEENKNVLVGIDGNDSSLNIDDVEVVDLKFFVPNPDIDYWQPGAVILLKIKYKERSGEENIELSLQTTVSSRIYR
jgi:prepilin-type N-terminal cleavage/methylation domain-containing protein